MNLRYHVVDVDIALARRYADRRSESQETVAGHAGQDCAIQLRSDQLSVTHEEDIHAAHLLHPMPANSVEEKDLAAPLLLGLPNALQGDRVVRGGLDCPRPSRCRA